MDNSSVLDLNVNAKINAELIIDGDGAQSELDKLFDTIQQKIKETTTREIGEYATAAGKAISDTLSAIFSGEMDKVQNIWDTAWTKMGEKAAKAIQLITNAARQYLSKIITLSNRQCLA